MGKQSKITNPPKRVFLQTGIQRDELLEDIPFDELGQVSWADNRIHKTDIEYVLKKEDDKLEFMEWFLKQDSDHMAGEFKDTEAETTKHLYQLFLSSKGKS